MEYKALNGKNRLNRPNTGIIWKANREGLPRKQTMNLDTIGEINEL